MRPRPILVIAALTLTACGSSTVSGSPSSSDQVSSAPSETSGAPSVVFTWPDGDMPAVTRELAGLNTSFINPGAVIDADGMLHMYPNLFTAWPGRVLVPHLTSTDGAAWTLASDEPVLTTDDIPFVTQGADVSTGFVAADGTWVLVFHTVDSQPARIGIATAPGPDGPWTVMPEPILEPDPEAEPGGLAWPSVVATDDGYAMYFNVANRMHGGGSIGMATSTDGLTWTRRDEPVLAAELDWEGMGLDRPRVARTDHGYVMVYAGGVLTNRGIAWSDDGVTWTRDGSEPAITVDDFPITAQAWDAALIQRDGVLTYYLELGGGATTRISIGPPLPCPETRPRPAPDGPAGPPFGTFAVAREMRGNASPCAVFALQRELSHVNGAPMRPSCVPVLAVVNKPGAERASRRFRSLQRKPCA